MVKKKLVIASARHRIRSAVIPIFQGYDILQTGELEEVPKYVKDGDVYACVISLDTTLHGIRGITPLLEDAINRGVQYMAVLTGNPTDAMRNLAEKAGATHLLDRNKLEAELERFYQDTIGEEAVLEPPAVVDEVVESKRVLIIGETEADAGAFRKNLRNKKYVGAEIMVTGYLGGEWKEAIQEHEYTEVIVLHNRGMNVMNALRIGDPKLPYKVDKKGFLTNVKSDVTRRITNPSMKG